MLSCITEKEQQIDNFKHQRLILQGGSNLSFGIDSRLIEDSLNIVPINLAIQGALGVKYYIDFLKKKIRSSDIVILSLEYQHFFKSPDVISQELLSILLDFKQLKNFEGNLNSLFYGIAPLYNYACSKWDIRNYVMFSISPYYSKYAFNKYGDIEEKHFSKNKPIKTDPRINSDLNQEVIIMLNDFKLFCLKNNVDLYFTYPSYIDKSYEVNKHIISEIENTFRDLQFQTLGTPEDFVWNEQLFFNSSYHLNLEGRKKRTIKLIQLIKNNIRTNAF